MNRERLQIIGIIPARYRSTRFEGKSLAMICGVSMIQRVYKQAEKSKALSRLIVATDDMRIFRDVEAFGGEAMLTLKGHKSGTDRVAEAASRLRIPSSGIIVNIQGDEPLLRAEIIDKMLSPLLTDKAIVMSTLVYRIRFKKEIDDADIVKTTFDKEGFALYFSRAAIPHNSSSGKVNYYKHLGLYAYRKNFLLKFARMPRTPLEKIERLEQLRVLESGERIKVVETNYDPVEVDKPEDIKKVERILRNQNEFKS